jgi:CCR4-NOT transcription complex subunit 1
MDTLLAAAEQRSLTWPSTQVQDRIHFIFNNVSQQNLDVKAEELASILTDEIYPFTAQYIVIKRASIEPNFHALYVAFLDSLKMPKLINDVVVATYVNVHVLLDSPKIATDASERVMLKNLGAWLGLWTLARNKPILQKHLDFKAILIDAYQNGKLIAVVPFVCKILEPCASSRVFRPPNPWVMAVLSLLCEIYNVRDLRLPLKFEVEMLHKKLGKEIKVGFFCLQIFLYQVFY